MINIWQWDNLNLLERIKLLETCRYKLRHMLQCYRQADRKKVAIYNFCCNIYRNLHQQNTNVIGRELKLLRV